MRQTELFNIDMATDLDGEKPIIPTSNIPLENWLIMEVPVV